ncbi:MAG: DUF4178 domain-containing protein [Spirochaetes bacterium]|jgi:hypothetical protein|nr:DUF4178 domain-containing protein [Spirochaetota bacterium]
MKPLQTIQCPSCGGSHDIFNPGIVTISCNYCGNIIYWDMENIRSAGKQALLPEGFSRLYRGATGTIEGNPFQVLGRVRYSFGGGFWDEWFIEYPDTTTAWLTEDNHEFSLEQKTDEFTLPPREKLNPGTELSLSINGKLLHFHIEEVGKARCLGIEGSLPKEIKTGEEYLFADGSSLDGKNSLGIEYDNKQPSLFIGKYLKFDDIKMEDESIEW